MNSGLYQKALEYAKHKSIADFGKARAAAETELLQARQQFAFSGTLLSGEWNLVLAKHHAKLVRANVEMWLNAVLDGCVLFGVPVHEGITQAIITEAQQRIHAQVGQVRKQAAEGILKDLWRGGTAIVGRELDAVRVPVNEIRARVLELQARDMRTQESRRETDSAMVKQNGITINASDSARVYMSATHNESITNTLNIDEVISQIIATISNIDSPRREELLRMISTSQAEPDKKSRLDQWNAILQLAQTISSLSPALYGHFEAVKNWLVS